MSRGEATQDEVELPGQVGGVADPRAHALTGEGRHLVSGVAGQEHPSWAPLARPSAPGTCSRRDARGWRCRGARPTAPAAATPTPRRSRSAGSSSGRRMNSQRRRPGPPDTTVVGRGGSQTCTLIGVEHASSCRTTSTMSQSKKNPRSVDVDVEQRAHGAVGAVAARRRSGRVVRGCSVRRAVVARRRRSVIVPAGVDVDRDSRPRWTSTWAARRLGRPRSGSSSGWLNIDDCGHPDRPSPDRPKRSSATPLPLRHS